MEDHRMKTSFWRQWLTSLRRSKPARPFCRADTRRQPLLLEVLEDRVVPSQAPHMLLDVNLTTASSSPAGLVVIGSTTYFSADDGIHGRELWKTDGTTAGTSMVKDVNPGSTGSDPTGLTNVNGTLLFAANDGGVAGLYKSDGTAAGTTLVMDFGDPNNGGQPAHLTNVNGTLFFTADDTHGDELWKSDGTAAGTVMLKDINPGVYSSWPENLTSVNGTLFFTAYDPTHGRALWKSDGTAAGTVMVKDIKAGPNPPPYYPSDLTNVNGTLYFAADDGASSTELWKSDGTTAGTVLVKDIEPEVSGPQVNDITNVNGTVFFAVDSLLFKSDGTAAGTTEVSPGQGVVWFGGSGSTQAINLNGILFLPGFENANGGGEELWKSDGTNAGTTLVKEIRPGNNGSYPTYLTNCNGTLLFTADDGTHGTELWKSDGTAAGTALVKDINITNPSGPAHASDFTSIGGTTLFVADDGVGNGLWKTNGTAAGTTLVKEFDAPGSWTYPSYLTNFNGTLFFGDGGELWKSDGTAAGTSIVSNAAVSTPLLIDNGTLFFGGGGALWKSDGTAAGTTTVRLVEVSSPLTDVNGTLFFAGTDANGTQLWKSNGTTAGTTMVKDIFPGGSTQYYYGYNGRYSRYVPNSSDPSGLTNVNGVLYVTADDGTDGTQLWKSDGTAAGTVMVKDINPGSAGSDPAGLTNFNGTLVFSANDGTDGTELWKSDGTAGGTVMVKDINPGSAGSYPADLTVVNNSLFFSASDGVHGQELWKSDGTAAGTAMVKDINPGSAGSNPAGLTNVNGTLFFAATDGTSGTELWQSDGTAAGTVRVKDINPGSAGSYPGNLANVNGTLFFRATDGVHGPQPWVLPANSSAAAASLAVSGFPATTTAGTPGSFIITAKNNDGSTDTSYTGTVHFTSSDGQAILPADYTFTVADAGMHTFTDGATFKTAGTQSITATDITFGTTGSETGITVLPAWASQLAFTQQPGTTTAGQAISPAVIVDVEDPYGNVVTSNSSTVTVTLSSGTFEGGSATATSAASGGVATFSTLKIDTAGSYTLKATDGSLSSASSSSITVTPAAASTLIVAGFPSPTTAGIAGNFTVTLKDPYGNIASGYTGTVHFTSSDGKAILPANYTFTASDAGVHSFSATLKTAGTQSITAADATTANLTRTDGGITVNPAAASKFIISAPSSIKAGVAFNLTLTVEDAYGNVVTGYTGRVHLSSTDTTAKLPANYTFTAADKGIHTFTGLVLRTKGNQKITITDTQNGSLTGSVIVDVL